MKIYVYILLLVEIAIVIALPKKTERIVGGSVTSISDRPFLTSLLYTLDTTIYFQACGGSIITTTAILSAAHCFYGDSTRNWKGRVGSTNANSGGIVHAFNSIIIHSSYNKNTLDNDVAVLRTTNSIVYNNNTQPARIASASYTVGDNEVVWAIGWGATSVNGPGSEQLRQVQIWTVNQGICKNRYAELGLNISDNMLCSGWLDVGGRDQCQGDSGGPLVHKNVVVGLSSWGHQCALPRYPGVNTRVSRYTSWIQSAARL